MVQRKRQCSQHASASRLRFVRAETPRGDAAHGVPTGSARNREEQKANEEARLAAEAEAKRKAEELESQSGGKLKALRA